MRLSARLQVTVGDVCLEAEIFDTPSALAVLGALPLETAYNTWGDEFYFEVPVGEELDDTATTKVQVGDIGYWPPGRAVAVFFGPTPMSTGYDPVPASEVNIIGRITGDVRQLKTVMNAGTIRLEEIQQ